MKSKAEVETNKCSVLWVISRQNSKKHMVNLAKKLPPLCIYKYVLTLQKKIVMPLFTKLKKCYQKMMQGFQNSFNN